jgi:hypothetical protein
MVFFRHMTRSFMSNETARKIRSFASLADGWHFGEGLPVSKEAIFDALFLHIQILMAGFTETDAFPGLSGEIQVTAYWNEDYFEFTRESDGTWTFIHENSDEEKDTGSNLSLEYATKIAANLRDQICNTSELFHEDIGTINFRGSTGWLSNHRPTMGESLWWSTNASPKSLRQFVLISGISTRESLANLPYSGFSLSRRRFREPLQLTQPPAIPEMTATET